jgi:hypothetical protein
MECMSAVTATKLIGTPERYSLKYLNLLNEGRDEFDLEQTSVRIKLGEFEHLKNSTVIHAEMAHGAPCNGTDRRRDRH